MEQEGFFYKDEQVIPGIHGMGKIVVRNYGAIHSSSDSMVRSDPAVPQLKPNHLYSPAANTTSRIHEGESITSWDPQ